MLSMHEQKITAMVLSCSLRKNSTEKKIAMLSSNCEARWMPSSYL